MQTARMGWIRDLPDKRDHLYSVPSHTATPPPSVDLRKQCPPVYDQEALGSCTANALAGAVQFDEMSQKAKDTSTPSRLFVYYNERVIEHSVSSDSGAALRDGIKSLAKQGACDETLWPYNTLEFATKPPKPCYAAAKVHRINSYMRVPQDLPSMQTCLTQGYPFVLGFTVYESFEAGDVSTTGTVPMPGPQEAVLGGHAVVCVGYDDAAQRFLFRNSWSASWGMQGYGTLPYAYLLDPNLAADFWTIRTVQ